MPGTTPFWVSSSGNGVPSSACWRIVSSNRITPLMKSSAPGVVNRRSRYARRFSSVDSTPIESKRFLIVLSLSSAARIPLPGATRARAMSLSSLMASLVLLRSYLLLARLDTAASCLPAAERIDHSGQELARRALEPDVGTSVERGRAAVDDRDATARALRVERQGRDRVHLEPRADNEQHAGASRELGRALDRLDGQQLAEEDDIRLEHGPAGPAARHALVHQLEHLVEHVSRAARGAARSADRAVHLDHATAARALVEA